MPLSALTLTNCILFIWNVLKIDLTKNLTNKGPQFLIGKLIYKCVAPAWFSMNRILAPLRNSIKKFTAEFFADLNWSLNQNWSSILMVLSYSRRPAFLINKLYFWMLALQVWEGIWSDRIYSWPVFAIPGVK